MSNEPVDFFHISLKFPGLPGEAVSRLRQPKSRQGGLIFVQRSSVNRTSRTIVSNGNNYLAKLALPKDDVLTVHVS